MKICVLCESFMRKLSFLSMLMVLNLVRTQDPNQLRLGSKCILGSNEWADECVYYTNNESQTIRFTEDGDRCEFPVIYGGQIYYDCFNIGGIEQCLFDGEWKICNTTNQAKTELIPSEEIPSPSPSPSPLASPSPSPSPQRKEYNTVALIILSILLFLVIIVILFGIFYVERRFQSHFMQQRNSGETSECEYEPLNQESSSSIQMAQV